MSTPFLGEIKICSFGFPPKGWALCNGQLLPINQNQALFSLLGTTYGGDGRTTFGLPDLRGRLAPHFGQGFTLGQRGGEEAVTINLQTMPTHTHGMQDNNGAAAGTHPGGALMAVTQNNLTLYAASPGGQTLHSASITPIGGSQPHENRQPFLVLNFIIALQGIFPSQN
jgi:microcystin-dependent protein